MSSSGSTVLHWLRVSLDMLSGLSQAPGWAALPSTPLYPVDIPKDFFGINIATSEDPACDRYVLDRVGELGIHNLRMDFTYESRGGFAQRLLDEALEAGYKILLDVFPPLEDARILDTDASAQERWRDFLEFVFARYGGRVELFEIGSTPNRGRWSGFSARSYISSWSIAADLADDYAVRLAGANISDFEPLYNVGFLAAMLRTGHPPDVQTDNLFVERVIEPEAYDHRVLGHFMRDILRLNLIKKAQIIQAIGRRYGVPALYCSYKTWTSPRLKRDAVDWSQKQADYLVRYLVLAATSGALERTYWGPLICNRDGLIDSGGDDYPRIDNVSYYRSVRGQTSDFVVRPAFAALRFLADMLSGCECIQAVSAEKGLNHYIFKHPERAELHVSWCRDRHLLPLLSVYPEYCLEDVSFFDNEGTFMDERPLAITEQALFMVWRGVGPVHRPTANEIESIEVPGEISYGFRKDRAYMPVFLGEWQGAVAVPRGRSLDGVIQELGPETIPSIPVEKILRDKRNLLWNIRCVLYPGSSLVVKLNRTRGIKRWTYRFLPSKGRRHWNNASEMLRRGINTPEPLAFFEQVENSGTADSYYISEFVDDAFSARDVFAGIAAGKTEIRGFLCSDLIRKMAQFIEHMHHRRMTHGDLSSGNLMMSVDGAGKLRMFLIDVGRAHFHGVVRLTPRKRMIDIMRICYKMDWQDRELFMDCYNEALGTTLTDRWRLPIRYYEFKQKAKKFLKGAL